MTDLRKECLNALNALYLEVDKSIADDIKNLVTLALDEADTLTDQQVEEIFKDGVYENPEFHRWEAERGAVTKLAAEYMVRYKNSHPKTHYTVKNLMGDIAVCFQDVVTTIIKYFKTNHPDANPTPLTTDIMQKGLMLAHIVEASFANPRKTPPMGAFHMTTLPQFMSLFKPFKEGGCEFIYGSPPRDEQCTKPPAYEIKSTVKGRNSDGRYLVCEKHKDELFRYVKGLDPDATIETLPQ